MNIFGFGKKQVSMPRVPKIAEATKSAWWHVFTEAIYAAVDDSEALLRARDPEFARKVAQGARNLADAALDEYEYRFAESRQK